MFEGPRVFILNWFILNWVPTKVFEVCKLCPYKRVYLELGPYKSVHSIVHGFQGCFKLGPYKSVLNIEVSSFQGGFILIWVPTKLKVS